MIIGACKCKDEFYYFRGKPCIKAYAVNEVSSLELWHARLRHPSLKISKLIPTIDLKTSSDIFNKSCGVCRCAKHTRASFPLSGNKTLDVFKFTHRDFGILKNCFFL